MSADVEDLPLAGLRIVDLTRLLPGPLATRRLVELGAEVIKVEGPPTSGQQDGARAMWQSRRQAEQGEPGPFFQTLNVGKQLRTVDLQTPAGRDELLALADAADAVVEGFRPGVMERLGLGWSVLHARRPALVLCSISGYGQHGPWAGRAGHDINYIAMAGLLQQIGADADGVPALPNFQIGDLLGGTQAAVAGLLAALLGAQRSGRGRHVDVSMTHEVWRHQVVVRAALQAVGHSVPPGRDLLSGGVPCYGVYRTADGRALAVGALELKFWHALCAGIDRPEWAGRHWALGQAVGGDDALALRAELAAVLASRPLADWLALFDPLDCCVTPVLTPEEARAHPLLAGQPPS